MRTDSDLEMVRQLGNEPTGESLTRTWYRITKLQQNRDRKPRLRVLVPVVAAALVAVIGAGSLFYLAGKDEFLPPASTPEAIAALNSLADAAAEGAPVTIGEGDLTYTTAVGYIRDCRSGGLCVPKRTTWETWCDPRTLQIPRSVVDGRLTSVAPQPEPSAGPSVNYPRLAWLDSLPTDNPDGLLARLRAGFDQDGEATVDAKLWLSMGHLYSQSEIALSPQLRAALLRAFTGMNGLSVRDVDNGDPRRLVAIRHSGGYLDSEILFDPADGRAVGRSEVDANDQKHYIQAVIYLTPDVTEAQRSALEDRLRNDPEVREVLYESKEQAYETFKEMFRDSPDMVESVGPAELPESFRVSLHDPTHFDVINQNYQQTEGVQSIVNQQDLLGKALPPGMVLQITWTQSIS